MIEAKDLFKHAIALTGGIASGKSTVCNLFKLHGFLTIDADKIAHKLLDIYYKEIENMFGKEYVLDNKVLRKKLGKIIFVNKDEKLKLENFIHPLIKKEIIKEAMLVEKANKTYFIDIPLFFETMNYPISRSLTVYTPFDIQIIRLMSRDKISCNEARLKISNQMDIEKKKELATYVINNSTDLKNLQNEVEKIIEDVL